VFNAKFAAAIVDRYPLSNRNHVLSCIRQVAAQSDYRQGRLVATTGYDKLTKMGIVGISQGKNGKEWDAGRDTA